MFLRYVDDYINIYPPNYASSDSLSSDPVKFNVLFPNLVMTILSQIMKMMVKNLFLRKQQAKKKEEQSGQKEFYMISLTSLSAVSITRRK